MSSASSGCRCSLTGDRQTNVEFEEETVIRLAPHIHARRLKDETRLLLRQHLDFLEEFTMKELALPRPIVNTDHVPVFFHLMSNPEGKPVFDTDDIEELGGEAEAHFRRRPATTSTSAATIPR